LRDLLRRRFAGAPLRFAFAGGAEIYRGSAAPRATVVLRDRATLLRMLLDPDAGFGEAYAHGDIEVRGDLVAALESAYRALARADDHAVHAAPSREHSIPVSRTNARRHYDIGNDFYRLWLDDQMVYTCAYFPTPGASLEEAQAAKLDLVCRKLELRPGERVAEAGCGWGALALHMARRYGVEVRAWNVSKEQVRYARERAAREGLARQVEFVEDDYRAITGRFDAFVSLGMLEHVGPENYAALGAVIDDCLDPERGRGLLHFIGRTRGRALSRWVRRRIFPGAYAPTLSEAVAGVLEPWNLSVIHIENLREHYARTLAHWRARFDRSADVVDACHGEEFTRAWRLYLAGSEAAFRTGSLHLFQVLFARDARMSAPGSAS
jgi:cyclopropane-fatty-acyl-phospholipid synthase